MNDLSNDLHTWLATQHHGLRTFKTFQTKLDDISRRDPEQRAVCRLLSGIVGDYVNAFDEAPLPRDVADRAHERLVELLASIDFSAADPSRRLADMNRVAGLDLVR